MKKVIFLFVPLSAAFASCSTTQKSNKISLQVTAENRIQAPSSGPLLSQLLMNPWGEAPLITVPESRLSEVSEFIEITTKYNLQKATETFCLRSEENPLCRIFQMEITKPPKTTSSPKRELFAKDISQRLKLKKFSELKNVPVLHIIQGARQLKKEELLTVSQELKTNSTCSPQSVYIGVSSALEHHFPERSVIESALSLLEKGFQCEAVTRENTVARYSHYRMAIFQIWLNQCDKAAETLKIQLDNKTSVYPARAEYWRHRCLSPSTSRKAHDILSLYFQYPISWHPLLEAQSSSIRLVELAQKRAEVPLSIRSPSNKNINDALELSEAFLKLQKPQFIWRIFERIPLSEIQAESPFLQIYVSFFLYNSQHNLLNFQILSRILQNHIELKTLSVLQMFYPQHYSELIENNSVKAGLDPHFVRALIRQESAFNPKARSQKNAMGLMQIIPALARNYKASPARMFEPEKNIETGVLFLKNLFRRFNNQPHYVLAAYNAGPSMMSSWLERYPTDDPVLFTDLIPFRETRDYVAAIMRNWYWYEQIPKSSLISHSINAE